MINIVSGKTHHSTEASQHLKIVFLPFRRIRTIVFPRYFDQTPLIGNAATGRGGTGAGMIANDCIEMRVTALKYVGPTFKCLQGCVSTVEGL